MAADHIWAIIGACCIIALFVMMFIGGRSSGFDSEDSPRPEQNDKGPEGAGQ